MKELADYKQEILRKTELLREKVAERLADEAKSGFSGAIVDELILKGGQTSPRYAQVDVSVDNRGSVTVVVASGEDAVWVEFGAGVYHNGSPGSSPHPHGAELGMTIGGFGKGNGKERSLGILRKWRIEAVSWYSGSYADGFAITTVCNDIQSIAKEVFG